MYIVIFKDLSEYTATDYGSVHWGVTFGIGWKAAVLAFQIGGKQHKVFILSTRSWQGNGTEAELQVCARFRLKEVGQDNKC